MAEPDATYGARLLRWYKADAITGLVDGDPVASWADSSAAADPLLQGTAAKRPLYRTALVNGLPAVRGDGVDDFMQTLNLLLAGPATLFVVAAHRRDPLPATGNFVDLLYHNRTAFSGSIGLSNYNTFGSRTVRSLYDEAVAQTKYKNGATTPLTHGLGEFIVATATSGTAAAGQAFALFSLVNGSTYFAQNDIAEVIVVSGAATAAERAETHSYLSDKYAITVADYVPPTSAGGLRIGAATPTALRVGSTLATRAYLGSARVFGPA